MFSEDDSSKLSALGFSCSPEVRSLFIKLEGWKAERISEGEFHCRAVVLNLGCGVESSGGLLENTDTPEMLILLV